MRTDCILPTNGLKSMPRIKLTSNMSISGDQYIPPIPTVLPSDETLSEGGILE